MLIRASSGSGGGGGGFSQIYIYENYYASQTCTFPEAVDEVYIKTFQSGVGKIVDSVQSYNKLTKGDSISFTDSDGGYTYSITASLSADGLTASYSRTGGNNSTYEVFVGIVK